MVPSVVLVIICERPVEPVRRHPQASTLSCPQCGRGAVLSPEASSQQPGFLVGRLAKATSATRSSARNPTARTRTALSSDRPRPSPTSHDKTTPDSQHRLVDRAPCPFSKNATDPTVSTRTASSPAMDHRPQAWGRVRPPRPPPQLPPLHSFFPPRPSSWLTRCLPAQR